MPTFVDALDRRWDLPDLTLPRLQSLRGAGVVDLLGDRGIYAERLVRLLDEPDTLLGVLWHFVGTAAAIQQVTREDMAAACMGPAADRLQDAMFAWLVTWLPRGDRAILIEAWRSYCAKAAVEPAEAAVAAVMATAVDEAAVADEKEFAEKRAYIDAATAKLRQTLTEMEGLGHADRQ